MCHVLRCQQLLLLPHQLSKSPRRVWASKAMASKVTYEELQEHNTPEDCWVVVGGEVFDLTSFASQHPGGSKYIHKYAGKVT